MTTIAEVAARHPTLVQIAIHEGRIESWTVDDPAGGPTQWQARYAATHDDAPEAMRADLAALLAELSDGDPVVWHRTTEAEASDA